MTSRILNGQTWHARYAPRRHEFSYRMIWLDIDLDELPSLGRSIALFGHNRRAVYTIRDRDYAGVAEGTIRQKLCGLLQANGVSEPIGRVALITLPRLFGYVFNPVSFFRCYSEQGELVSLVAEVHNTFGESHHYVLRPLPDRSENVIRFEMPKAFYVSPFLKVDGDYEIILSEHDNSLSIMIHLRQDNQLIFSANMSGLSQPVTKHALTKLSLKLPLMIGTVMLRITWQALKLYFRKQVQVINRPVNDSKLYKQPGFWDRLRGKTVRFAAGRNIKHQPTPTPIKTSEGHSV